MFLGAALLQVDAMKLKEEKAREKEENREKFVRDILNRFSKDGKVLSSVDVASWLGNLTPNGNITQDELRWILLLGNRNSQSGARYQGLMKDLKVEDACLAPDSFDLVMSSWLTYVRNKPTIDGVFARFDVDQNGSLSRAEVSNMLTMLNNGVTPDQEDMEWVIRQADEVGEEEGIETPELLQLISAWFVRPSESAANVEDEEEEAEDDQDVPNAKAQVHSSNEKVDPASDNTKALPASATAAPSSVCGPCCAQ
jgi:Ca2+-binding EF-hand superfamily protein